MKVCQFEDEEYIELELGQMEELIKDKFEQDELFLKKNFEKLIYQKIYMILKFQT